MLTVCSVPVVFSSTQVSLLDPDQSLTAKCFHVSWLFIICCQSDAQRQPIIDMGNDFRTRSLCTCHANSSTLSMNIKSWSDRNIYIYIKLLYTRPLHTLRIWFSHQWGHNKEEEEKKKRGARETVPQRVLSITLAILVQRRHQSPSCVGIEFTSFQESGSLFWNTGKLILTVNSSLLLLPLTFPLLCFPAKPDGVAKVSPLWASI